MRFIENMAVKVQKLVDTITWNNLFDQGQEWSSFVLIAIIATLFVIFFRLGLKIIKGFQYKFADNCLILPSFLGRQNILLSTITEIKKIKRNGGCVMIRIVFRRAGRESTVNIRPRYPLAFVHDLVSECPQLKGFNTTKLKRDASFKAAIAGTA